MGNVSIGTSGWVYPHWKGIFYPQNLPQKEWLRYYSQSFDTVEVNATFYHQMKATTFENWQKTVGRNFTFTIKASRFITHIKRLKDCRGEVERFFETAGGLDTPGVSPRRRRGPSTPGVGNVVLWQLPPGMKIDPDRLKSFLALIHPRGVPQAQHHPGGVFRGFRQAFEFRHQSWFSPNIYKILKENNTALVIADSPYWPKVEEVTSDFVYLRFHGGTSLYASNYSDRELREWAEKIKKWQEEGLDVYGYFNNDAMGYAIKNAKSLIELVSRYTTSC